MSQITDLWARWRRNEAKASDYKNQDLPEHWYLTARSLELQIIDGVINSREDLIIKLKLLKEYIRLSGSETEERLLDSVLSSFKTKIPTIPACKHEIVDIENNTPLKELFHV